MELSPSSCYDHLWSWERDARHPIQGARRQLLVLNKQDAIKKLKTQNFSSLPPLPKCGAARLHIYPKTKSSVYQHQLSEVALLYLEARWTISASVEQTLVRTSVASTSKKTLSGTKKSISCVLAGEGAVSQVKLILTTGVKRASRNFVSGRKANQRSEGTSLVGNAFRQDPLTLYARPSHWREADLKRFSF